MFHNTLFWCAGGVLHASGALPIIPIFVLPYKRFASTQLIQLANHYLDNDDATLRSTTTASRKAIAYRDHPEAAAFSHTTLYRWLIFFGAMTVSLAVGCDLFLQVEPTSTLHRFDGPVSPAKARSDEQLKSLSIARRLLYLQRRWDVRFPKEHFFPRFATVCRSP